jgi:DNA polymerase/3'-5' exonuclease PolX
MSRSVVNYLPKLIAELDVIHQNEVRERNVFKARAYAKVLGQLRALTKPVHTIEDLEGVSGIGENIRAKIQEIIVTGALQAAEDIKNDPKSTLVQDLMAIYGVGPVKAKALMDDKKLGLQSMTDLRAALIQQPDLLNDKQKIGLKYVEDMKLRIPRSEVETHERVITKAFKDVDERFVVSVVGSYRRQAANSGDIDVLVTFHVDETLSESDASRLFLETVTKLKSTSYIIDVLALGNKKCMAFAKLGAVGSKARRLDILLTPPKEYPFALMYFTGSDKFNVQFRKKTLEQGYSLSEHGLKRVELKDEALRNTKDINDIASERDIFTYFNIPYVSPEQR